MMRACRMLPFRLWRGEAGVSSLEVAFVLPVLLAMLFGLVEFGYNLFARSTVEKAAQVGTRFAVTGEGYDTGNRVALIKDAARPLTQVLSGSTGTGVTILVRSYPNGTSAAAREDSGGDPCQTVEVQVDYRYAPLTPLVGSLLPAQLTVTGRERMVNEPWAICK
ncbi:TadE/TadG family type IV pilus assembly protein [Nitratidesulfovibrio sp. D1]|uniref:TadE/TadG family type IV pilus assembly protein n=1 Tax=Nitratidesulfovibrio sp. D1 TaxID=3440151 RepID=UPI003EBDC260